MEEQTSPPLGSIDDNVKYDPAYRQLADYLNVDINTQWNKFKPKLDYILEWGQKTTNSQEIEKIIEALREVESNIGTPNWEEKRITHIYRNLRLDRNNNFQKAISLNFISEQIKSVVKESLRKVLGL